MELKFGKKSELSNIQNELLSKIKDYILYKNLEPGDKLPSERVLCEKFDVSRRNLREAIAKLEYYELLKSVPQTGTFVADVGHTALNGIIEGIVSLKKQNFKSLVETRIMLEAKTSFLAAKYRSDNDLENIALALNNYIEKINNKEDALEEDLLFHLAIAKACGNSTINALMLQIMPKIIFVFKNTRVCNEDDFTDEIDKHKAIYQAIKNKEPDIAIKAMKVHFNALIEFCNNYK
ncbi:FCD domain-containing protein [Cellulophaga baltica]|uniref:FadR/GntR family transcriptional regulator n=1 Tax=Cellulophaga TaxID=104264 RepID=UPI001C074641|nr:MULTISPECIES: FCD domain-containing protein [Cellulophaga]MBU2995223.1 FCD domain-containing protein [Cellulophaga baltica]MDO6766618.1 FCD domain-containing protein [Cellulophaga sp. 1_MG-2023]